MPSRCLLFTVSAAPAFLFPVPCGCFVMGLVIVGKLCLVFAVRWCEVRNLRVVFGCSLVSGVLPVLVWVTLQGLVYLFQGGVVNYCVLIVCRDLPFHGAIHDP
jgi:hypothetical protein